MYVSGVPGAEVAAVDIDREDALAPGLEMAGHEAAVGKIGEAEERRGGLGRGLADGRNGELDLSLGERGVEGPLIAVRPGVRADRMAAAGGLANQLGIGNCHAADDEEGRLGAMGIQCLQHRHGVGSQRPVVERQHDLAIGQEVVVLVLLLAEELSTRGVDLHDPRHAENIGAACARVGARCPWLTPGWRPGLRLGKCAGRCHGHEHGCQAREAHRERWNGGPPLSRAPGGCGM